jgi:hypothetical protein
MSYFLNTYELDEIDRVYEREELELDEWYERVEDDAYVDDLNDDDDDEESDND